MNKKLTNILLSLIVILVVLLSFTYKDILKSFNNDENHNLDITEDQLEDEDNIEDITKTTDKSRLNQSELPSSTDDTNSTDESIQSEGNPIEQEAKEPIVLAFAGDVNLDEDSRPVARYDSENKGILGGISQELVEEMNKADIFMLNNEFAYSTRGSEILEKSYTFRAHPKRVNILKEMGVDIVSLANNHALDFGREALEDTFATLEEAGIDYVGAGANMDRAKAPIYYTIGDKKIAYIAASHVIYAMDWYATDERSGMVGTYDPTLIVTSIEEASKNSDFVIIYVHWGKERVHEPVEYQKNLARIYIDAGADAVIGCHPHVMQGLEFYKGKIIAYSLGNYWFNASTRVSGLLKIYLNPDGTTDVQLLPVMNKNMYTYLITKEDERDEYYKFMEDISFDVEFDNEGWCGL
ncbi:MAG: CapA family protein [Clostridiales bacterium]|nr:CapA family protein [Clostridiales bacterium]